MFKAHGYGDANHDYDPFVALWPKIPLCQNDDEVIAWLAKEAGTTFGTAKRWYLKNTSE